MININFDSIKNGRIVKSKEVRELIESYLKAEKYVTWRGFLIYSNIGTQTLSFLTERARKGEKDAVNAMVYLEKFKIAIETKIEEYLIYQESHEDLQGKRVDFKTLQWVLEKTNPQQYGNVKVIKESLSRISPTNLIDVSGIKVDEDEN